jgi:hypothetical protein
MHETENTGTNHSRKDASLDVSVSSDLQSSHDDDAGRGESAEGKGYFNDDADLRLKALETWIARKASDATLADVATIITNVALVVAAVVAAFIYHGQLAEMKHTNELTQKALDGSDKSLQATLTKMQGQIDVASNLYKEAQNKLNKLLPLAKTPGDRWLQVSKLPALIPIKRKQSSKNFFLLNVLG